jgi:light-regulated signal transduction histidine kinase (bacteriophytochrome)
VQVGRSPRELDGLIHRPPGGGLILELEPVGPAEDLSPRIAAALKRITTAPSRRSLCDEAAKGFKELAGYDRVMVYRFDPEGHGEVLAERREPGLEPFLGNRCPASDIPQIARQLCERNRIRMLVDVAYQPVPLSPGALAALGRGSRHVALLSAQHVADPHPVPEEHGSSGDAGGLAAGGRAAVGPDRLSSLRPARGP